MKKVLVLGKGGMLGSMVHQQLSKNSDLQVIGTDRDGFDAESFVGGQKQKTELKADYIVNCIGVIKPFCKDNDPVGVRRAIAINGLFPHRLSEAARMTNSKLIQIATDCVYSGSKGQYSEIDPHDALDVYGKSKSLGEVFDRSLLNIRCSIIGPELKNKVSLLEWFLSHREGAELNGFTHHRWNGVTTLQFAKLCEKIITTDGLFDKLLGVSPMHHFIPNSTVDKYELLCLMRDVFERKVQIKAVSDMGPKVDRTLATKYDILSSVYPSISMRDALVELRQAIRPF